MHVKFVEQKNWSQELKVKVNTYYHKMLESYFGRPEDLIELVNDILTRANCQDKSFVHLPRKQLEDDYKLEKKVWAEAKRVGDDQEQSYRYGRMSLLKELLSGLVSEEAST